MIILRNIQKLIYFKRFYYYQNAKDILEKVLFENGEIIFENNAGGIVKYNID